MFYFDFDLNRVLGIPFNRMNRQNKTLQSSHCETEEEKGLRVFDSLWFYRIESGERRNVFSLEAEALD